MDQHGAFNLSRNILYSSSLNLHVFNVFLPLRCTCFLFSRPTLSSLLACFLFGHIGGPLGYQFDPRDVSSFGGMFSVPDLVISARLCPEC